MTTATELIGKRITVFGTVATVTGPGRKKIGEQVVVDEWVCVITGEKMGEVFYVFAHVIDAMPETIRRDSFDYRP